MERAQLARQAAAGRPAVRHHAIERVMGSPRSFLRPLDRWIRQRHNY
jgi:hypothetical protein